LAANSNAEVDTRTPITDNSGATDGSIARGGGLAALLHPVTPESFFREHWNQKALYIPGGADKFAGLFDRAAFDRAGGTCADLKVGFTDEKGWPAHFNIRPEQIPEMLSSAKTVCASVVDPHNPVLTAFLQRLSKEFAVAGKFFLTPTCLPTAAGSGCIWTTIPFRFFRSKGASDGGIRRNPR
jgi:hypothetical protein